MYSIRETVFLAKLDALVDLSVQKINKECSTSDSLESDEQEYKPYAELSVEIEYFDLRVFIDFKLYNTGIEISAIDAMDSEDTLCPILADELYKQLESYYQIENKNTSYSYQQAREIASDNREAIGLKKTTPTWIENKKKYKNAITKMCLKEPSEQELNLLFEYGSAGKRFKTEKSYNIIVREILPLIDANIFPQIKDSSRQVDKAQFLESIFTKHDFTNYKKGISAYYQEAV